MYYKISYNHPRQHFIDVELILDNINTEEVEVYLPAWRPGRYELQNFAKNIQKFKVESSGGDNLGFKKITKDKWVISTKGHRKIHIKYNYYAAQLDAGACWLDETQVYVNPVHLCMYVKEKINEPCTVELSIPGNYIIATSMRTEGNILYAEDYHELVDSPFIASDNLKHFDYRSQNIKFHFWIKGEATIDIERIKQDFKAFTDVQIKMFEEVPFDEYHFLFQILPFRAYHGVEHLKSTVIALGPGYNLMKGDLYEDLLGISSHELFHAWNVKAVRPSEMTPYNYEKENYNRLGFVTEGVTTYYGDLHLLRSKVFTADQYFKDFNKQLQKHFDNYGRFNLSVADSSFDTWLDGYSEGIPNRKTSIYTEGCLAAFMLDILIMENTGNKKSLDDVILKLYKNHRTNGYTEEDYLNIASEFAGVSVENFFNSFIYGTTDFEPLLVHSLNYIGCELIKNTAATYREKFFGIKSVNENGRTKIKSVAPGSPAFEAGLTKDDEVYSVNNFKVDNNFSDLLESGGDEEIVIEFFSQGLQKIAKLKKNGQQFYPIINARQINNPSPEQKDAFLKWAYRL